MNWPPKRMQKELTRGRVDWLGAVPLVMTVDFIDPAALGTNVAKTGLWRASATQCMKLIESEIVAQCSNS